MVLIGPESLGARPWATRPWVPTEVIMVFSWPESLSNPFFGRHRSHHGPYRA